MAGRWLTAIFLSLAFAGAYAEAQHRSYPLQPKPTSTVPLPNQSGQSQKFLTTNGTNTSWASVTTTTLGAVPILRNVGTTSPLGGGGALSGSLNLTCASCVTLSPGSAQTGSLNVTSTVTASSFVGGGLDRSGAVALAGTNATSLSLGRGTIQSTAPGGITVNTSGAQPACASGNRGQIWIVRGVYNQTSDAGISDGGITDTLEVCLKNAADVYAWTSVVNGG